MVIYHEKLKEAYFISHIQLSFKIEWSEKDALDTLPIDLYPVLLDRKYYIYVYVVETTSEIQTIHNTYWLCHEY